MSQRVTGPFEVKVTPQKPDTQIARAANLGRLTFEKRFHGELEAISKGEMLATQTEVKGSAVFFFQAEDGIRDLTVTGVQTCALPIFARTGREAEIRGC